MSSKENKTITEIDARQEVLRGKPSLALIGLLIVEMIIGYEWFISGLTKIVLGDFPSGLAAEMGDKLADVSGWYGTFLSSVVIPNAAAFGYVIEISELLVGIALIAGPLAWLFAWDRIPRRFQSTVVFLIAAASIGGIFMAINFHLANGNSHPWLIPQSSFDEGVDFDSLLAILNIVTATVNVLFLSHLTETKTEAVAMPAGVAQKQYS